MAQELFFVADMTGGPQTSPDFLLRRLHSLAGLAPIGVFVILHLGTNVLIVANTTENDYFQEQVDRIHALGPPPLMSPSDQEVGYPLSRCMTCGCCLEACPQINDGNDFIGPAAISQAVLFNTHLTGKNNAGERLDALTAPGGIQGCGNAQNCVKVCPKDIPLTDSIAKVGRAATFHVLKRWFDR